MKISDYYTYAPKSKIKAGDANPNGRYQFYASSPDKSRRCDEYLYDCKAIIMGTGGSATLHYYDGKFSTSTDCLTLIPNENIRAKYLYYFFLANMDVLEAGFKGAGLKHTNKGYIDNIEITKIPSLSSQDKIVNLFDGLASRIEKERRQIEKLDELVKARFIEMFGDVYRTPKYPKQKWNEVVTIKNGKDYKKVAVKDGGYPVYGTGGEMARVREFLCPENTIIVGRKGTINNPLLVREKFWNVDTAFGVIPGIKLHYLYFFWFCKMFDFSRLNRQAVLPSTTKADLLNIEIQVPPIEVQNQFATFVTQVDKSKFAVQKSLEKTQLLFDSLMQEYFG